MADLNPLNYLIEKLESGVHALRVKQYGSIIPETLEVDYIVNEGNSETWTIDLKGHHFALNIREDTRNADWDINIGYQTQDGETFYGPSSENTVFEIRGDCLNYFRDQKEDVVRPSLGKVLELRLINQDNKDIEFRAIEILHYM